MAKKSPPASQLVDVALAAKSDTSIATLAAELLRAFGGPARLADAYALEFSLSKEGGMARQRMLQGVISAVTQASAQSKGQAGLVDGFSEEELQAELLALLTQRGLVPDPLLDAMEASTNG